MLVSSSLLLSSTCDSTETVSLLSTHGSGNILLRRPIYMKLARRLECGHFTSEFGHNQDLHAQLASFEVIEAGGTFRICCDTKKEVNTRL